LVKSALYSARRDLEYMVTALSWSILDGFFVFITQHDTFSSFVISELELMKSS